MKTTLFQVLLLVVIVHCSDVDFGWVTPIHGSLSNECLEASRRYIRSLGGVGNHQEKDDDWGRYMMDANGRLPLEGFLSDKFSVPLDLCDIFGPAAAPNCEELPEFLTHVVVKMPVGFSRSPGSMDLCLSGVHTKFGVKTQYCTVSLQSPEVHIEGAVPTRGHLGSFDNLLKNMTRMTSLLSPAFNNKINVTFLDGLHQFQHHVLHIQNILEGSPQLTAKQVKSPPFLHSKLLFAGDRCLSGNLRAG